MPLTVDGTDYILMPVGTTAQRPVTPVAGMTRYNSDTGLMEYYNGSIWNPAGTYTASFLNVAGGGAGNDGYINSISISGGGGGAGGLIDSLFSFVSGTAYTITIGAGGAYAPSTNAAASGSNSVIGAISTAIGGGGGGKQSRAGSSGGSGGGGGGNDFGGAGTAGQGNNGGDGNGASQGGGGGGFGTAGSGISAGIGFRNLISGSSVTYASGGVGGYTGGPNGSAGAANTGNGGGGGPSGIGAVGGNGGSGVVIISYVNPTQRATGGTVTSYTSNSLTYWVHTFTTSGTFTA
jgi:hypothetical protein